MEQDDRLERTTVDLSDDHAKAASIFRTRLEREVGVLWSLFAWVFALLLAIEVVIDVEMIARCDVVSATFDVPATSRTVGDAVDPPTKSGHGGEVAGFADCGRNDSWWMWAETITANGRSELWAAAAASGVALPWWRETQASELSVMVCFVALFYSLIAFGRRDDVVRSSTPYAEITYVMLAKLAVALAVATAVALVATTIVQVFAGVLASASVLWTDSDASVADIWLEPSLYLSWLHLGIALLAWVCWALPCFAWSALAAALVPRFRTWVAVGVPVAAVLVEWWFGYDLIRAALIRHLFPDIWPVTASLADTLGAFLDWRMWGGAALGATLLAGAVCLGNRSST